MVMILFLASRTVTSMGEYAKNMRVGSRQYSRQPVVIPSVHIQEQKLRAFLELILFRRTPTLRTRELLIHWK